MKTYFKRLQLHIFCSLILIDSKCVLKIRETWDMIYFTKKSIRLNVVNVAPPLH